MKIGILTFHWAANHGAVLQSYASFCYLKEKLQVEDVKIIDYLPKRREINLKNALKPHYPQVMISRIASLIKENRIKTFRKKFVLTSRYYSNRELIENPPDCDILLAGSDQIWNQSYTLCGEQGPTLVYFLNFGKEGCKKIGLSASFGCVEYPDNAYLLIKEHIYNFDAISVRENTGIDILKKIGVDNAIVAADPTSLLERDEYLKLCSKINKSEKCYTALCILRKQERKTKKVIEQVVSMLGNKVINIEKQSIENWLAGIRDANYVVTNSFHCVMMCLKLHTPFAVVLDDGKSAGMNDRFITLLNHFNLENCIIMGKEDIEKREIDFDWKKIDVSMENYASTLKNFLKTQITGEK